MTQTCDLHPAGSPVRPADPYTLDQCRRCWVLGGGQIDRPATRPPARRTSLPCVHEGPILHPCPKGDENLHVRACREEYGRTTRRRCGLCEDRFSAERVKVNPVGLLTQPNGHAFNPSLIRHGGRWLMAYRTGWAGSRIAVCEVNPRTGEHGDSTPLRLATPPGLVGHEDPRLFVFRGELHVSYTAYLRNGKRRWTDVRYARLADDLSVEQDFTPRYAKRQPWEKNWVFFEGFDGRLYCVYSVSPHVVLRVDGDRTEAAGDTPCPIRWDAGHLRGGCPPVFVAGEWWHWFHGAKEGGEPNRRYSVGLYTFEATPPFRIKRWLDAPVEWASESDWKASGNYCRVVFPGGAVLDGDTWRVAVGVHDRACEVWSWSHAELAKALGAALG